MAQAHNGENAITPAARAAAITPNDSTDLAYVTRGIYIGTAGNISVDLVYEGVAVVFSNVLAGTILPVQAKRVRSTSTTAGSLVGLY